MSLAPRHPDGLRRCQWCGTDPAYVQYHDTEWGVPLRDDRALFEMLCLEGAQAGLSWLTILRKRDRYRDVFDHFDAVKMAHYRAPKIRQLLADPGIVRNRLKVRGFVKNARAYLAVCERGSFSDYIWQFAPRPRKPRWRTPQEIAVSTPESDALSKDLKNKGFTFVGTTICYAFMQAVGLVDDHQRGCWVTRRR